MNNGNGVSRGDRNRNARLARLRELVPVSNAIVGIDPAARTAVVQPGVVNVWLTNALKGTGYHYAPSQGMREDRI